MILVSEPKNTDRLSFYSILVALIWKKERILMDLPPSDYASRKEVNEKLGDLCVRLNNYDKAIHYYLHTLEVSINQ